MGIISESRGLRRRAAASMAMLLVEVTPAFFLMSISACRRLR
ncbi:MAG: hypothetical protein Q7R35_02970 [Elusimicrobiota bacterium]|nr:hypothetical protein [Elusimicrobiota bacterium]